MMTRVIQILIIALAFIANSCSGDDTGDFCSSQGNLVGSPVTECWYEWDCDRDDDYEYRVECLPDVDQFACKCLQQGSLIKEFVHPDICDSWLLPIVEEECGWALSP